MIALLGLAILLFASTNIDDVFVLLAFFADGRMRARSVVIGQYVGIAVLVAISIALSLLALAFSSEQIGLLGLLPILIGLKRLTDLVRPGTPPEEPRGTARSATLAVAAVTIANGGDNIGVYAPVFATRGAAEIAGMIAVFAAMTALWLALGYGLLAHQQLGAPLRRYGQRLVPLVLIGLGLHILYDAGSLRLLAGVG